MVLADCIYSDGNRLALAFIGKCTGMGTDRIAESLTLGCMGSI